MLEIFVHRGQLEPAGEVLSMFAFLDERDRPFRIARFKSAARSALLYTEGRLEEAVAAGSEAAAITAVPQAVKQGFVWAVDGTLGAMT